MFYKKKCLKTSWRRWYYPHRSKDAFSPVCGIFFFTKKKVFCKRFQPRATVATSWWASSWLIQYTEDKSPCLAFILSHSCTRLTLPKSVGWVLCAFSSCLIYGCRVLFACCVLAWMCPPLTNPLSDDTVQVQTITRSASGHLHHITVLPSGST